MIHGSQRHNLCRDLQPDTFEPDTSKTQLAPKLRWNLVAGSAWFVKGCRSCANGIVTRHHEPAADRFAEDLPAIPSKRLVRYLRLRNECMRC